MSKVRRAPAVSFPDTTSEIDDREPEAGPTAPSSPAAQPACLCKSITANLAEEAEGYKTTHVELKLTSTEANFLARLRCGLSNGHVQLSDGRHVETAPQSLRWLLQQAMHHTTHLGS